MKRLFYILILITTSSLYGQNIWEQVNFPDSLTAFAINAEKDDYLFVSANNNKLYRSQNEGLTWEIFNSMVFYTLKYSPDGVLLGGAPNGIYASNNDGESFEKLLDLNVSSYSKISISPDSNIYVIGWHDIMRSNDFGLTWETLYPENNVQYFTDIDFGLNGEIYLVGGTWIPFGNGFLRSLDNGVTWESTGPEGDHLQSVRVNDSGVIIVGGRSANRILQSNDLGITWGTIANVCADVMESYSDQKLIAGRYIDQHTGCWFSEDWGNTWIDLVDNMLNPHVRNISISPSNTVFIRSDKESPYTHQIYKSINPILDSREKSYLSKIELYPNPTKGIISILSKRKFDKYIVYNQNGKIVLISSIENNSIDISSLETGIYIIELANNTGTIRRKIIKK